MTDTDFPVLEENPVMHRVTVRRRPGSSGKVATGSNTQVLIDGELLRGARRVTLTVEAGRAASVNIELMVGEIEIEHDGLFLEAGSVPCAEGTITP